MDLFVWCGIVDYMIFGVVIVILLMLKFENFVWIRVFVVLFWLMVVMEMMFGSLVGVCRYDEVIGCGCVFLLFGFIILVVMVVRFWFLFFIVVMLSIFCLWE